MKNARQHPSRGRLLSKLSWANLRFTVNACQWNQMKAAWSEWKILAIRAGQYITDWVCTKCLVKKRCFCKQVQTGTFLCSFLSTSRSRYSPSPRYGFVLKMTPFATIKWVICGTISCKLHQQAWKTASSVATSKFQHSSAGTYFRKPCMPRWVLEACHVWKQSFERNCS